jgi:uncharacterized protein (TIGR02453 family)
MPQEAVMPAVYNPAPIFSFLSDLNRNNRKAWFDAHRDRYEAARTCFEDFIERLIDGLRLPYDLQDLTAKACLARIYRDVRFSRDKSPYNTNFSAMIAPGGRKSARMGCHVSLSPGGKSLIAGGLYMVEPAQLAGFRRAIDTDPRPLKKIVQARRFVEYFGQISGEKLSTAPQGYNQTHPEIDLLRLKQVLAMHSVADAAAAAPGFPAEAVKICKAMQPFLQYLENVSA